MDPFSLNIFHGKDDICDLMEMSSKTLLKNLECKYNMEQFYTYISSLLIAVNPKVEGNDIYSNRTMDNYAQNSIQKMPPHSYAIAKYTLEKLKTFRTSQSIVLLGETGSGKSTSTSHLTQYLYHASPISFQIEAKIVNLSLVLEAFGNAKTSANNNSSRFGKYIEVNFDEDFHVVGVRVTCFLLERSRICIQSPDERNFHIFYMICAAAPENLREKLGLFRSPEHYAYLNGCSKYFATDLTNHMIGDDYKSDCHKLTGPLKDPFLDDYNSFQNIDQAMSALGFVETEKLKFYEMIAAILHLGNVNFENDGEGCRVTDTSQKSLEFAATLLHFDILELRKSLTSKEIVVRNASITCHLVTRDAIVARDTLAKAVYGILFDRIVAKINESTPKSSKLKIGILDCAGFECFAENSFEQFCINYGSEYLHSFCTLRLLQSEYKLYCDEGLSLPEISIPKNQQTLDLLDTIFTILDDEVKFSARSSQKFWQKIENIQKSHPSSVTEMTLHSNQQDISIRHFAGNVIYNTEQFAEKNLENMSDSLRYLIQESFNCRLPAGSKSVSGIFREQFKKLIRILGESDTNFICCINPNKNSMDRRFDPEFVLSQLESSGAIAFLELLKSGYPTRMNFVDLYDKYKSLLPTELVDVDPKIFCVALLRSMGLKAEFGIGKTKVFFRVDQFTLLDVLMKSDEANIRLMTDTYKSSIIRSKWSNIVTCMIYFLKLKKRRKSCHESEKENFVRSILTSKVDGGNVQSLEKRTATSTELVTIQSLPIFENKIVEDSHKIPTKRRRGENIEGIRYDSNGHFPNFDGKPSKSRCKMDGCSYLTHVYCVRCDVSLCFVKGRNCFWAYHCKPSK